MESKTGRPVGHGEESGKHRATLSTIAKALDVSAMTVSNAYNHPDRLSEALRERILETARELGYHGPDPVGRSLRRQRTDVVGVLYSNPLSYAFNDPAAVSFLSGLSVITEGADLGLLLLSADESRPASRDSPAAARAAVDGFVIYSMGDEEPALTAALGRRLPSVVVDQPIDTGLPFVAIDDEGAARTEAEHLLALGHRRFAVVSFALSPDGRAGIADAGRQEHATFRVTRERLRGYQTALEAADLLWSEVPVHESQGSTSELGYQAAEAVLSAAIRPTAILAASDQLALGVVAWVSDHGLSVPEDVSVVGFDDIPAAAASHPPLTTIHQDHTGKGLLAGRLLIAHLRQGDRPEAEPLATHLVVRDSTGPPRHN